MLTAWSSRRGRALPQAPCVAQQCANPLQPGLFDAPAAAAPARAATAADQRPAFGWTEEELVLLHWRLLRELHRLPDPEHPLAEKIDALNWVFCEPEKEAAPFSFANCLRVVGCSPLSPTAFFGLLDAEAIREWIRAHCARWLQASLARYPDWMRALIAADPDYVVRKLDTNPQWINEQVRERAAAGDLFE